MWQWSTTALGNTHNLGPYDDATNVMWALISIMIEADWSKVMDSDGSTYSSSGSQVTRSGSGANGLGNSNAWIRLQDPDGVKEIIWQRGATDVSWKALYSASDKFASGSPDATTLPTAADQQGFSLGTGSGFSNVFDSATSVGPFYCHVTAEDSPTNGIYPAWMVARTVETGEPAGMFVYDSLEEPSTEDTDPALLMFGNISLNATSGFAVETAGSAAVGWMGYGTDIQAWGSLSMYPYKTGATSILSIASTDLSGAFFIDRPLVNRYQTGFKGRSSNLAYAYSQWISYGQTIVDENGDVWLVVDELALRGWPSADLQPRY